MRGQHLWAPAFACLTFLLFLAPPQAPSQQVTQREDLLKDLVVVQGGKMAMDEVGIMKIRLPAYPASDVQVKFHAEAPATDVISRDNFVSLSTTLTMFVLFESFAEAYESSASEFLQNVEYRELKAAIGKPDLEMNIYMTAEGLQFEIVNTATGETTRTTQTWQDVLSASDG